MPEDPNRNDGQEKLVSVNELEEKIKADPNNAALKEELAAALVQRHLGGEEESDVGSEPDISRLRQILADLPREKASYARAYVAHLDKKDDEAVGQLVRWARGSDPGKAAEPLSSDELYLDVI